MEDDDSDAQDTHVRRVTLGFLFNLCILGLK